MAPIRCLTPTGLTPGFFPAPPLSPSEPHSRLLFPRSLARPPTPHLKPEEEGAQQREDCLIRRLGERSCDGGAGGIPQYQAAVIHGVKNSRHSGRASCTPKPCIPPFTPPSTSPSTTAPLRLAWRRARCRCWSCRRPGRARWTGPAGSRWPREPTAGTPGAAPAPRAPGSRGGATHPPARPPLQSTRPPQALSATRDQGRPRPQRPGMRRQGPGGAARARRAEARRRRWPQRPCHGPRRAGCLTPRRRRCRAASVPRQRPRWPVFDPKPPRPGAGPRGKRRPRARGRRRRRRGRIGGRGIVRGGRAAGGLPAQRAGRAGTAGCWPSRLDMII
jgi:hypothetical protein